jgi:hypothetical protein
MHACVRLHFSIFEISGLLFNLPTHLRADKLKAMRALSFLTSLALSIAFGQASTAAPAFDVA